MLSYSSINQTLLLGLFSISLSSMPHHMFSIYCPLFYDLFYLVLFASINNTIDLILLLIIYVPLCMYLFWFLFCVSVAFQFDLSKLSSPSTPLRARYLPKSSQLHTMIS